jgi:hypothetical protein
MCLNCLSVNLETINKRDERLRSLIEDLECPCCIDFAEFLRDINGQSKVLVLTKMKRGTSLSDKLCKFEKIVKQRITESLNAMMEVVEEDKDEISDGCYLHRMDNLKAIYDEVADIEDSDHR